MKTLYRFLVPVLAVLVAAPLLFAAPGKDVRRGLSDEDAEVLLAAAADVRAGLSELRGLQGQPLDKDAAARAEEARARVKESLKTFLDAAGLTAEELVRIIDADGGLDNGKEEHERPELRPLERPRN